NTGSNDLRLDAAVESEPGRRETGDAPFAAVRRGPNGAERSGGGYAAADAREQRRRRIVRNGHGRKRSGLVEADAAGGQRRTVEEDRDGSCASSVGDRSIGIGPRVHECRAAGHEAAPVAVEEVEERNGATVAGSCGRKRSVPEACKGFGDPDQRDARRVVGIAVAVGVDGTLEPREDLIGAAVDGPSRRRVPLPAGDTNREHRRARRDAGKSRRTA